MIKDYERKLDSRLSQVPQLVQLEHAVGVPKVHLLFYSIFAILALLSYRLAPKTFVALVLYLYPAIKTVQAIEKHDKNADVHWLSYWLVIGTFMTIVGGLVGEDRIRTRLPLYNWLQMAVAVWMAHPRTRGSVQVYDKVIRPLYLQINALTEPYLKACASEIKKGAGGPSSGSGVQSVKMNLAKAAQQANAAANNAIGTNGGLSSSSLGSATNKVKKVAEEYAAKVSAVASGSNSSLGGNKDNNREGFGLLSSNSSINSDSKDIKSHDL